MKPAFLLLKNKKDERISSNSSYCAPSEERNANIDHSFIIDCIPLPSHLLLRSKSYLSNLYNKQHLSANEIGRQLNVSHSTIISALQKSGIYNSSNNGNKQKGQIPFGYDYINGKYIKNKQEQDAIRIMKQLNSNGKSLRNIAAC